MTGMKSLLARASSGSKKDPQAAEAAATHPNTGNGSSHGSGSGGKGMIPDDARSPPSKRAATQAAVEEGGKGKLYATTTHEEVPPRAVPSAKDGPGDIPACTLYEVLEGAVKKWGTHNALAVKRPKPGQTVKEATWKYWTYQEYRDTSLLFARALVALGFQRHGVINILGFNAPEWFFAYMGAMMAGGVAAGIYITNGPEACHYITAHSEAEVVVVDDVAQLQKYAMATQEQLPRLKAMVLYGGQSVPMELRGQFKHPGVRLFTWAEFLAQASSTPQDLVVSRAQSMKPGHCVTLIYTSGTTGPPKAVMLSHDNLTWAGKMIEYHFEDRRDSDTLVSYLPLSHIAAQMIDVMVPLGCGGCVYFAQPDALKGSLVHTLKEVRPAVFFAVPRVWEKMYEAMQEVRKATPLPLRVVSDRLKRDMKAYVLSTQFGEEEVRPALLPLAEKMFDKVKEKLGLDRTRYCATGAAPLSAEIQEYFASLGVTIFEVFGQSEATGLSTCNCPRAWKLGTVGRPYPGQEVRLDPANGEYQYRGRHVFMGYMKMEEETRDALLPGGWLRSGDVATIDADHEPNTAKPAGFVRITGRIKELIITAGGENIPPVLIENELKAALPSLASCMVIGDKRKFLTVLLTLHTDDDGNLIGPSKASGAEMGSSAATIDDARACALWKKHLDEGVRAANKKATSRAQCVQKWWLLDRDFSEKEGDLTPTLKLKRSVVAKKHAQLIDSLYA